MADIKLTYFDGRGRAEISRLILNYARVKFTDDRLQREQFAAMKPSLPWGQVPVLDYNGQVLCQSLSIARFGQNKNHQDHQVYVCQVSCC